MIWFLFLLLSGCVQAQGLTQDEVKALEVQYQHLRKTLVRVSNENDRLRGLIVKECRP